MLFNMIKNNSVSFVVLGILFCVTLSFAMENKGQGQNPNSSQSRRQKKKDKVAKEKEKQQRIQAYLEEDRPQTAREIEAAKPINNAVTKLNNGDYKGAL